MSRKYTYHRSHSYKLGNIDVTFITQLYKVGIYGIINNDPDMQGSFTPARLVTLEKKLKKEEEEGEISNLEFGKPITVQKSKDGLLEEVDDQT